MGRIELPTPSLPRKCSTAELHRLVSSWAEDGARTRHLKLGRLSLCQMSYFRLSAFDFVGEGGLEPPNSSEDRFTVCCNCHYATPPLFNRAGRRTRTADRLITNQLLYQLSYTGIMWKNTVLLSKSALPHPWKSAQKYSLFLNPQSILEIFFKKNWI